jgi:hypothetical protein
VFSIVPSRTNVLIWRNQTLRVWLLSIVALRHQGGVSTIRLRGAIQGGDGAAEAGHVSFVV